MNATSSSSSIPRPEQGSWAQSADVAIRAAVLPIMDPFGLVLTEGAAGSTISLGDEGTELPNAGHLARGLVGPPCLPRPASLHHAAGLPYRSHHSSLGFLACKRTRAMASA